MPARTRKAQHSSDEPVTVYPVRGLFLNGVPAVPTTPATRKEAEALVATGAFSFDRPPEPVTPEPSADAAAPEPAAADEPPAAEEPAPSPEEA